MLGIFGKQTCVSGACEQEGQWQERRLKRPAGRGGGGIPHGV